MTPDGNLAREEPELLDPVRAGDADLLRFESDGDVSPRLGIELDGIAYQRAVTSIRLYHLKDPRLRRARADTIRKVHAYFVGAQFLRGLDGDRPSAYTNFVAQIRASLSTAGEYSAAVMDVLGHPIRALLGEDEAA